MRTRWIARVTALTALSLAACSADNNSLLDGDLTDDIIETPDVIETDVARDTATDTARDVATDTARDAATDATDAARDAAIDVPRDTVSDVAIDTITDVPRDAVSDAVSDVTIDAPRDAATDTAIDAASDAPRDTAVDTALDVIRDVPRDTATDTTVDTATDVSSDVARDVISDTADAAPDNGCGTRSLCAGVCIDTQTDTRNCGLCGVSCAAPSNASSTCVAGRCGYACNAGFHDCGGACVSNAAVATCGSACSPCAARANATATCDGSACRYACNTGFADCDGVTSNGCERAVSADVSNCGGCGTVCAGADTECRRRSCSAGVCGFTDTSAGTALMTQPMRDCRRAICDGRGNVTQEPLDTDLPVDGNPCTDDVCMSGVASNPPTMSGRSCGTTGMLCDGAGACVECLRGSDCSTGVCTAGRCQAASCSDGVRNGTETGIDCGGGMCPLCPVLVFVAGGSTGVVTGSFDTTARSWVTSTLASPTVENVSAAVMPSGDAMGLIRYTRLGDTMDNRLRYTLFHAGAWAPFADIGPTVTTQGPVAVTPASAGLFATFHGFDYNHYFAVWTGSAWSPTAEVTGASGARAGALARDGANPLYVFSNGLANELYSRSRAGTTWGGDQRIDSATTFDFNVSPAAVNLTSTSVLAVWSAPGGQLRASVRTAGTWTAPANIPSALSTARVSLARVTASQAVLAYRGTDGALYVATYASGAWGASTRVTTGITGVPSIATGVGGATAEMAFLDASGRVKHARLSAGTWTIADSTWGTGLSSVAIASGP